MNWKTATKEQKNDYYKEQVKMRFNIMKDVLMVLSEDKVNTKMQKDSYLDSITNWCFKGRYEIQQAIDNINMRVDLTSEEKDNIIEYGLRRVYTYNYSHITEFLVAIVDNCDKEVDLYSKTCDVVVNGYKYDVKMVDWNNGNPNYHCYRDYGQRKIWVCVDTKSECATKEWVQSLLKHLKERMLTVEGQKNVYIKRSEY